MASNKSKVKFYVVWTGRTPGIYDTWEECKAQVHGVAASYKSYPTLEEAQIAYRQGDKHTVQEGQPKEKDEKGASRPNQNGLSKDQLPSYPKDVIANALAVDAACSGNPGAMEYRGVYVGNFQEIFHYGPIHGTNNIGEFLAIVHGLAMMDQHPEWKMPIYSDSKIAIGWVTRKKCNTKLEHTTKTNELYKVIARAEKWLKTHTYDIPILKWDTKKWGEIPADFGRKG
ncbi:MAG TPA: ribonuclease H family protein [Bacteroidaceae bacterium]|nr:ribonuclease H family protein [Bacteroidaceae bacterium]